MGKLEVVFTEEQKNWCVEIGETLAPMDDVELWDAIYRGVVTPAMRVWRLGLGCWTRVADVPELEPILCL
jgi:hypothetical protein